MKKLLLSSMMLLFGLLITTNLLSVDYYVDPTGTDDGSHGSGPGTDAWQTIQYAVDNVLDPTTATIVIHVSGDTYTLNNDDINIDRDFTDLTIDGEGIGNTIVQAQTSSGGTDEVFYIYGSDGSETVTISDMTIRNGTRGIYFYAGPSGWFNGTVSGCDINNNNTPLNHSGGGIYAYGYYGASTLTVINSTIHDNSCYYYGGGIQCEWNMTLTMTNCTINDNSNDYYGAGLTVRRDSDSATLTNCTITGNDAADYGGAFAVMSGAELTLTNCTVTRNNSTRYGGLYCYGATNTINTINTIFADNTDTASSYDDWYSGSSTVNDNGYNLVEHSDYNFNATGDITGEQANLNISSTLADNGSLNETYTLALLTGSVAIDAGTDTQGGHPEAIPTTDQRGLGRNSTTDMGAYEYEGGEPTAVTLSSFTATYSADELAICWSTQSESNNAGWNIYRADNECIEEAMQVNGSLIEGAGTTSEPTDYTFYDINPVQYGETYNYWLESRDYTGATETYGPVSLTVPQPGDDPNDPDNAEFFGLYQNIPNPLENNTTIRYNLKEAADCKLVIYNTKGQTVKSFTANNTDSGAFVWDRKDTKGNEVASGLYFYRLDAGDDFFIKKMVVSQ